MRGTSLLLPAAAAIAAAAFASSSGCAPIERHFGTGGEGGAISTSHTTTSGSGGATSSSSSGSGVTSSSSSSSGGGVETDCTNGVDDDGDGLVDCADSDCTGAGYQCAADAPTGWSGPALLYTGLGTPPACGADWTAQPVTGGLDVNAAPASCTACTCDAPVGVSCDTGSQLVFSSNPSCGGGQTLFASYGQCIPSPTSSMKFVAAAPPKALGGSCAPSGGAASVSPAEFDTQAALCASPASMGSGCAGGACVPRAPSGYGPSLCIFQPGDLACPAGPYANKTLIYGAINDERDCAPCACDTPVGSKCTATLLTFSSFFPGCTSTPQPFPANGTCFQIPGSGPDYGAELQPGGPPTGGSCAPSGGDPIGQAVGAQPTTVCCQ